VETSLTNVAAAWCHGVDFATNWVHSFIDAQVWDFTHDLRIGAHLPIRVSSSHGLPRARNRVVEAFLASDMEWLWWSDTDMGFEPSALDSLLAVADPEARPIMGALCFINREIEPDGRGGYVTVAEPALFRWVVRPDNAQGFGKVYDYTPDAINEVAATGSAFVVIHRSVFEKVAAEHGPHWYDLLPDPGTEGGLLGEDLSFCVRAQMVGCPVHVHAGVKITHQKTIWLDERHYPHPSQQ
jgi:GT2 family glycosyltransferase